MEGQLKTINSEPLSFERFKWLGTYADLRHCEGPGIGSDPVIFYRDIIPVYFGTPEVSFSVVSCQKRPLIIDEAECHTYTAEVLLPLDGDVILFAAPATDGEVPFDGFRAFTVPAGTLVVFKPGVWHKAPFPLGDDTVNTLVVLPQRAYANDCKVAVIPGEKRLQIAEAVPKLG